MGDTDKKDDDKEKVNNDDKSKDDKDKEQSISGVPSKGVASPTVLPRKALEVIDKKEFSFGVRYNYWSNDMEDLIGIAMTEKDAAHKTFRDELINNKICKLSEFEYNILAEKAEIYFDTEYCQENIEAGVNTFGIRLLAKITKNHIIACILYCNYDM